MKAELAEGKIKKIVEEQTAFYARQQLNGHIDHYLNQHVGPAVDAAINDAIKQKIGI